MSIAYTTQNRYAGTQFTSNLRDVIAQSEVSLEYDSNYVDIWHNMRHNKEIDKQPLETNNQRTLAIQKGHTNNQKQ